MSAACVTCSGCTEIVAYDNSPEYQNFIQECISDPCGQRNIQEAQYDNNPNPLCKDYYTATSMCNCDCGSVEFGQLHTCDGGECRPTTCDDLFSGVAPFPTLEACRASPPSQCGDGSTEPTTFCCGGVGSTDFSCEQVPLSQCPPENQVSDCCECDNNPDPTCNESGCPDDQILCCIRNGSFITCGCRTPEECQASTGSEVSNCSQCIPGSTGPTGPTGPSGLPTPEDIVYILPNLLQPCSTDPVMRGYIKYINATAAATFSPIYDYAAPYLWDDEDETLVRDWSFYDYGSEYGLIPGISDPNVTRTTRDCLNGNGCYNTTCLSANALEALRRTVVAESQLLSVEKELVTKLRDEVSSKFKNKWLSSYASWYQRNAFFFSKKPGSSIFRNEDEEFDGVNSELSLFNIKKITRKEIRGSRYELLSRAIGITGASAGEWLYDIYFGGDEGSTAHPYYDQGYTGSPFITSRAPHAWFGFSDSDATDDPSYYKDFINFNDRPYGPQYRGSEFQEPGLIHVNSATNNSTNMISGTPFTGNQLYGYAQHDLRGDVSTFKNTFNFYNLQNKKPSNVKKEEISSYVRIEFTTPIGLDKIKDFPNGFIRDAGVEYFLPYIVNITPGPMGRQSVKYNIAVIGMDPYGFDVAVKRIKDDLPTNRKLQGIDKGNYYKWWNHDTGMVLSKAEYLTPDYNGMDLWPEEIFETAYPYYAYDPSQEDLHGGGYDLDFHMGGGYYFENDSQDWMESLYHYGVSSGKQFDPLYRTSVLGSYILPNSYRKLKPHRSWWSLFVPRNLFIPIRFSNMLKSPNTKARDMFGGRAIFTINPNYWRTWYGSEFETWLSLENNGATRNLLTDNAPDLRFYIENVEGDSISAYAETTNAVQQYFHDSLMNYLAGDHIISQRLVDKEDLWKYDLSGETEYGLVTPPVDAEYDVFDRNFAAQFTVVGKPLNTCKDLGFSCADKTRTSLVPENVGECEKDITYAEYCGCKNYSLMPSVKEPTLLDLHRLKKLIKEAECYLLDKYPPYGKDSIGWIGCDYGYPDATWSCDCTQSEDELTEDDLNEKLDRMNVLSMVQRTYAMFWGIDQETYPNRTIFESNIKAQQIRITVPPNDKVNIGDMVEVLIPREDAGVATSERKFRKFSGKWLVAGIDHDFDGQFNYKLSLTLIRDSMPYENSPSSRRRYKYQEQLD